MPRPKNNLPTRERVTIAPDAVTSKGALLPYAGQSGTVVGRTVGGRQWRVLLDSGACVNAGEHILIKLGVTLSRIPRITPPLVNHAAPPKPHTAPRKRPAGTPRQRSVGGTTPPARLQQHLAALWRQQQTGAQQAAGAKS